MLCAPLEWQYTELPSSARDAVLCTVLVRCGSSKQIKKIYIGTNPWKDKGFDYELILPP